MNKTAVTVWWVARILSIGIILLWGFFIVAYFVGEERSIPVIMKDCIGFTAMVVSLLGLAVAWKWERIGGAVTLVAVAIGVVVNGAVLMLPCILMPVNAVLFLLSSLLAGRRS